MSEQQPPYDRFKVAPPPEPTPIRREHRCGKCGRLIAVGVIAPGTIIEIKCRCNAMNVLSAA